MTESNNYDELATALMEKGTPFGLASLRLKLWALTHPDNPASNDIIMILNALDRSQHESDQLMEAIHDLKDIGKCQRLTLKPEACGWTIGAPGKKPVFFYDLKGFQYLHKLLLKPGEPIPCTEIIRDGVIDPDTISLPESEDGNFDDEGEEVPLESEKDLPLTDRKTVAQAKNEWRKLEERKQCALNTGNEEGAAQLEEEQEKITQYLASVTGKGGRIRKHGPPEKARTAALNAIKRAMKNIENNQPSVYKELKRHLRTGGDLTYTGSMDWDT